MPDPWAEFHLEDVETEPCIRYRSVVRSRFTSSVYDNAIIELSCIVTVCGGGNEEAEGCRACFCAKFNMAVKQFPSSLDIQLIAVCRS